jgi:hypothetical protein
MVLTIEFVKAIKIENNNIKTKNNKKNYMSNKMDKDLSEMEYEHEEKV